MYEVREVWSKRVKPYAKLQSGAYSS